MDSRVYSRVLALQFEYLLHITNLFDQQYSKYIWLKSPNFNHLFKFLVDKPVFVEVIYNWTGNQTQGNVVCYSNVKGS